MSQKQLPEVTFKFRVASNQNSEMECQDITTNDLSY